MNISYNYLKVVVISSLILFSKSSFSKNYELSNDFISLILKSNRTVDSLFHSPTPTRPDKQLIQSEDEAVPLMSISYIESDNIKNENCKKLNAKTTDKYTCYFFNSGLEVDVLIKTSKYWFRVKVLDIRGETKNIENITFFSFKLKTIDHENSLNSDKIDSNTLLTKLLPLNINTFINRNKKYTNTNSSVLQAVADRRLYFENRKKFVDSEVVLITAPRKQFLNQIEKMIKKYHLPYRDIDGIWFRKTNSSMRKSYLFTSISDSPDSPDYYKNIVSIAKKMGINQIVITTPTTRGSYSKLLNFKSMDKFYSALKYINEQEILVGLHTFMNRIDINDPYFEIENPGLGIYKIIVGQTNNLLSIADDIFLIDTKNDLQYEKYVHYTENFYNKNIFLVGKELIQCDGSSRIEESFKISLSHCNRGYAGTKISEHNQGAPVFLAPHSSYDFFVDVESSYHLERATDAFSDFVNKAQFNFIYSDGYAFVYPPNISESLGLQYSEKFGVIPYVSKIDNTLEFQYGNSSTNFNWYWTNKIASWDGAEFYPKKFTKNFKVDLISRNSLFKDLNFEMGWWKILSANLESGRLGGYGDLSATTLDEMHFAMTKVVAYDTSIGLQISDSWYKNNQLDMLFDTMQLYQQLIKDDINKNVVPSHIKDALKNSEIEAELNNVNGYNFIKKKVVENNIIWNKENPAKFKFSNPFGDQRLKVMMRPSLDYLPFRSDEHLLVSDFSKPNDVLVTKNNVNCHLATDRTIIIENQSNRIGTCTLKFSKHSDSLVNLLNKRGMGIKIDGNSQGELVIVRLKQKEGFGVRDFKFYVDFSGEKELTLRNPTTDLKDIVYTNSNGKHMYAPMPFGAGQRSWKFDYRRTEIELVIHVKPKTISKFGLYELKALKEKPPNASIINPKFTINDKAVVFPVNLSTEKDMPYFLEYDGYSGEYRVLTANLKILEKGNISLDDISIKAGTNSFEFSADSQSENSLTHALIKISMFDDEDGDLIPTNGSFLEEFTPKNPSESRLDFYDDNAPSIYNPDQNLTLH